VIGFTYCALAILGVVFGSLLLDRPERFADQNLREKVEQENKEERQIIISELEGESSEENNRTTNYTVSVNSSSEIENIDEDIEDSLIEYSEENFDEFTESVTEKDEFTDILKEDIEIEEAMEEIEPSTEMKSYHKLIKYIKKEGIEAIIGSLLKLFCSILLVKGARMVHLNVCFSFSNKYLCKGKPWFLIPWLVEETIEMVGGFIHFTIQAARNKEWSIGGLLLGLLFYILGCYFLYTVASFHTLLRRMNKNSSMIVASVSQGVTGGFQSGLNYQRLEEECWQSEPNIASEFSAPGFIREKKVDLEEDGDEHVLYVQ